MFYFDQFGVVVHLFVHGTLQFIDLGLALVVILGSDGGQRGVANDRLGIGMRMICGSVPDALIHEIAEAALTHVPDKPPRQIAPKLINGDLEDKFGWARDRFAF